MYLMRITLQFGRRQKIGKRGRLKNFTRLPPHLFFQALSQLSDSSNDLCINMRILANKAVSPVIQCPLEAVVYSMGYRKIFVHDCFGHSSSGETTNHTLWWSIVLCSNENATFVPIPRHPPAPFPSQCCIFALTTLKRIIVVLHPFFFDNCDDV